jgi:cell division protein FtsZ
MAPATPAPSGGTSLFNRVTGKIGKLAQPAAAPAPKPAPALEPVAAETRYEARPEATRAAEQRAAEHRPAEPRPAVRPAVVDEMAGLEIPAFLRRQHS